MNLYRLQVISTVADLLSFSRAAEHLHLSQPAVSQHVREAERYFGVQLFQRNRNRTSLTEAGRIVQGYARRILSESQQVKVRLAALEPASNEHIVIASTTSVANHMLPPLVSEFQSEHPQTEFVLHVLGRPLVLDEVARGAADIGYLLGRVTDPRLAAEVLGELETLLVVAPRHPLGQRRVVTVAELTEQPLIVPVSGSSHREQFDRKLRQLGIARPRLAAELGSPDAMKRAAELGLGLTLLPSRVVARELQEGTLVHLKVSRKRLREHLHLLYRKGLAFSPRVATFVEFSRLRAQVLAV